MEAKRESIAGKIASALRKQIADGAFRPGEKLPSIRDLAQAYGYSKNTVVDAFERLVATGEVEARRGAGYFVSPEKRASGDDMESLSLRRAMDTVWMMRQQTYNDPDHLPISHGIPPASWLMENHLHRYQQKVTRGIGARMYHYGSRFGYHPLRQAFERSLYAIGIEATANQIVITNGANHAMDLIIRCLARPGENILVDEPGYYPLYGKIKLHGAVPVGVPRMVDGPNIAALEERIIQSKARLFFTQSIGHNPTGSDISPAIAHRLLTLADKHDLIIVENDAVSDLKPLTLTRLTTLDQLRRTIYVGSVTKSVSASLRVGFIACHPDLAGDLADLRMLVQVSGSEYNERLVDEVLRDPSFPKTVARLRQRVEVETERAYELFRRLGATIFTSPAQSLYLWASLPQYPDSLELARKLLEQRVALAPGAVFSVSNQKPSPWSRYNTGYVTDPRFVEALEKIA